MNKVKYGLKNVHYSIITYTDGLPTYATPVALPGAVELKASPKGDKAEFYADDMTYFVTETNQGYEGTLECALLTDTFKKDVLGYKEDKNNALFEDANAVTKDIALLFEFSGDVNATRHVFYNVTVGRPAVDGKTKGKTTDPSSEVLPITASPAVDTRYVKAKAEAGTVPYSNWFNALYKFVPQV